MQLCIAISGVPVALIAFIVEKNMTASVFDTVRGQLKCDGTRAETRFRLSAKRTSPFKSAGASVQSTTGSRIVRISGSNAGYTMFRGSVMGTGYPLHSPVSPFTSPPVRHRVPSHTNWTLPHVSVCVYRWLHCSVDEMKVEAACLLETVVPT